jgi:hypothetical protein
MFKHPDYSSSTLLNDVAIIKLKDLITLSGKAQPACLTYEASSIFPGTNLDAWIVGWVILIFKLKEIISQFD